MILVAYLELPGMPHYYGQTLHNLTARISAADIQQLVRLLRSFPIGVKHKLLRCSRLLIMEVDDVDNHGPALKVFVDGIPDAIRSAHSFLTVGSFTCIVFVKFHPCTLG